MQDLQIPVKPCPVSPALYAILVLLVSSFNVVLPFCTYLILNLARTSFMKYRYLQQKKDIGSFLTAEF